MTDGNMLLLPRSGAYTCQLCSIDPNYGDSLIWLGVITKSDVIELPETVLWYNNYTITPGTSALVDGAKRDRLVCRFCPVFSLPLCLSRMISC